MHTPVARRRTAVRRRVRETRAAVASRPCPTKASSSRRPRCSTFPRWAVATAPAMAPRPSDESWNEYREAPAPSRSAMTGRKVMSGKQRKLPKKASRVSRDRTASPTRCRSESFRLSPRLLLELAGAGRGMEMRQMARITARKDRTLTRKQGPVPAVAEQEGGEGRSHRPREVELERVQGHRVRNVGGRHDARQHRLVGGGRLGLRQARDERDGHDGDETEPIRRIEQTEQSGQGHLDDLRGGGCAGDRPGAHRQGASHRHEEQ